MVREGRQPRHSGRPSGHSAGHVRTTDAEYSGEKYLGLVQRVRPASASCGEQRPHQPTLGGLGGVEQQQCLVRCRVGSLYPCASGRPQDALMRSANWRPVSPHRPLCTAMTTQHDLRNESCIQQATFTNRTPCHQSISNTDSSPLPAARACNK